MNPGSKTHPGLRVLLAALRLVAPAWPANGGMSHLDFTPGSTPTSSVAEEPCAEQIREADDGHSQPGVSPRAPGSGARDDTVNVRRTARSQTPREQYERGEPAPSGGGAQSNSARASEREAHRLLEL